MAETEPADGLEEAPPPRDSVLRRKLRTVRRRVDNLEVRRARVMMRALRESPVDVLAIGDSMWAYTAPYDQDQRHLAAMITHGLGDEITMHGVVDAGYNANLIDAYLGLAQRGGFTPVLIVPLTVRRVTVAWGEHPNYTYRGAVQALSAMPGDIPLGRIRKAVRRPTVADFEAYDKLEITAFGETAPIGDFRLRLKQPERFGLDREGREKLLYAFHHGESIGPVLSHDLQEHGCEAIHGIGLKAFRIRQWRQGKEGPIDVGAAVDQVKRVTVVFVIRHTSSASPSGSPLVP